MTPDYQSVIKQAERLLEENFVISGKYVADPPVDVLEIAKNEGLEIIETYLSEIDGKRVSGFIDPEEKKIYVHEDDSVNRRVFTIAHELGHWVLHGKDLILQNPLKYAIFYRKPLGEINKDPLEKEANCFAGNLLVPRVMLEKYKHLDDLTLSKIFGVSGEVIGFRRQNNGF